MYKKIKKEMEHRKIVELYIKRKLKTFEVIHHLDGNKKNNQIENLMLFFNQSKHKSFHNKIRQFGFINNIKNQIKNRWNNEDVLIKV